MRVDLELTEWFKIASGTRQGCCLSPYLFNIILEVIIQMAMQNIEEVNSGVTVYGTRVNNLRFADDIDLISTAEKDLQKVTTEINKSGQKFGLIINIAKTKTMVTGKQSEQLNIKLQDENIEQVKKFIYLGSEISEDGTCEGDIKRRIGLASAAFGKLQKIWKDKTITSTTKIRLYEACVIPVLLYGSECWTVKKKDEKRLLVTEMSWLRGTARISRRQRMRNEKIREILHQEETVVDRLSKRRLQWFGHVERMNDACWWSG